ncbi:MAG TPA: transcriptional regulator [Vicinamibacterales bacterium]|jgi:DNA-binding transcriptional ArsR family regulator|nr:transcriptional regulator [Vicinamibacterales bacterium]
MAGRRAAGTAARVPAHDVAGRDPRLGRRSPGEGGNGPAGHAANARDLDRLVHDRTRLAIVSALAANASLTFTELKGITETTDGNLSVHTRKLEDAGYVSCTKSFEGRVPRTEFALTAAGRRALQKYLDHMEAIIVHARRKARG